MIPKKIHYCWFGGNPLPELAKKCIASWKKFCPDYEIIEWNEKNFDIDCCPYVREAYQAKKWAFVSDYARLDIVYKYGGIYLDTDVELIRNLDELLKYECFLGTEKLGIINTGLAFGAESKNKCIGLMLKEYNDLHFKIDENLYDLTPCPKRNTAPFLNLGFIKDNRIQKIEEAIIYPPEYFCPMDYETGELAIKENTISIHHFNASWKPEEEKKLHQDIGEFKRRHGKLTSFIYKNCLEYQFRYKSVNIRLLIKFIFEKIRKKVCKLMR